MPIIIVVIQTLKHVVSLSNFNISVLSVVNPVKHAPSVHCSLNFPPFLPSTLGAIWQKPPYLMSVHALTQSRVQYLPQPISLYSYPQHAEGNDMVGGRYGGSRWASQGLVSVWCLSGGILESDHGLSRFHQHLLVEIQIITSVLMWVVVLICSQSQWSTMESLPSLTALLISSKMKRGRELVEEMHSSGWFAQTIRHCFTYYLFAV